MGQFSSLASCSDLSDCWWLQKKPFEFTDIQSGVIRLSVYIFFQWSTVSLCPESSLWAPSREARVGATMMKWFSYYCQSRLLLHSTAAQQLFLESSSVETWVKQPEQARTQHCNRLVHSAMLIGGVVSSWPPLLVGWLAFGHFPHQRLTHPNHYPDVTSHHTATLVRQQISFA